MNLQQLYDSKHGGVPCDVHRMVKGDSSPKASSRWCRLCGAFICDECRPNVTDRLKAALMRFMGKAA